MNHDKIFRKIKMFQKLTKGFNPKVADGVNHIVFDAKDRWRDMKDYLNDLIYFSKDYHNPSLLFPKNFQKIHEQLSKQAYAKRKRETDRIEAKRKGRRALDNAAKEESKQNLLSKYCKQFTGMVLNCGDFTIKPLISMDEFNNEASHMYHCIVSFYGKENTLHLSVEYCVKKCETSEINLMGIGKIIQCRGVNNQPSNYLNEIVGLSDKEMNQFLIRLDAKVERPTLPVLASQYKQYLKAI